jgi:hypothetical protein
LNPGQIAGKTGNATEQAGSPNKQDIHLGWAETHGHYSTFIRAELIIKIAGDPPVMTGENPIRRAVSELVAAHCVMLHSTGTLRIIPASVIDERILTAQFQPSEFISHQKLLEIGKFSSNPRLKECPQKIAIDIVPALWCESAEGKDFAKSMGWLVKRTKRERHLRQR